MTARSASSETEALDSSQIERDSFGRFNTHLTGECDSVAIAQDSSLQIGESFVANPSHYSVGLSFRPEFKAASCTSTILQANGLEGESKAMSSLPSLATTTLLLCAVPFNRIPLRMRSEEQPTIEQRTAVSRCTFGSTGKDVVLEVYCLCANKL